MIDVENHIFDAVYREVAPLCAKNCVRSVVTPRPTAFPAVTLYELDNRTDYAMESTQAGEDYAILTYEARVYAQSKQECRKVYAAVDEAMRKLNMSRFSGTYVPLDQNVDVHEYIARYRVETDGKGTLYRAR